MPEDPTFDTVTRDADALFVSGYPPLGAVLAGRREELGGVIYELGYRRWRLVIRLHARGLNQGSRAIFSCRFVGSALIDSLRDTAPWTEKGSSIVEPVLVGSRDFENVAECMAEAYHRIIRRKDVQRAIRRDSTWPISA